MLEPRSANADGWQRHAGTGAARARVSGARRLLESAQRDLRSLRLREISIAGRVRLLFQKYAMRVRPMIGLPARSFTFESLRYHVTVPSDAALLQRVLVDTHEYLDVFELTGKPDVTVVDVGAHNGETTIACSLFLDRPTIYAFEPDPVAYACAVRNAGSLAAVLENVGLSDHEGDAPFDASRGSGGGATFALDGALPSGSRPLRIARGDDVLHGVSPDLVKIDVEGYERHVIDGLQETLGRSRFLSLELSLARPKDHRFHEIATALGGHRFELIGVGEPHRDHAAIDLYFRRSAGGS